MKILVTLLVAGAGRAAFAGCAPILGSFPKHNLTARRVDALPGRVVTLIERKATRRAVIIGARRLRTNTLVFRLLDQDTNNVDDVVYPSDDPKLKRVTIHDEAPEILEARRRAGEKAERAWFEPHENTAGAMNNWLDLKHPMVVVVAREDHYGLEVLEGTFEPWPERRPEVLTLRTADGPRRIPQMRLVAAFGRWAGF